MNNLSRVAATINSQGNPFGVRSSLFHCTPVLERRRRTHWDNASSFKSSPTKFNQYSKRLRKQTLLRNVSEFADHLFQSWQSDRDEYEKSSSRGSSWFRPSFRENGYRRGKSRSRTCRRDFEFCTEDEGEIEFETIFRSAFGGIGGTRYFYWSFNADDEPRYRTSSSYSTNFGTNGNWKFHYEEEYSSRSSNYEKPIHNIVSDRLALGLSPSGPLNLEDVKTAYRSCALKWHPDRHQGSSKAVAEEKFKACSVAYQSLCDKLDLQQGWS